MQLSPLRALVGGLAYATCTPWACHPELPHERARPSHRIVTSSRETKGAHTAKALNYFYHSLCIVVPTCALDQRYACVSITFFYNGGGHGVRSVPQHGGVLGPQMGHHCNRQTEGVQNNTEHVHVGHWARPGFIAHGAAPAHVFPRAGMGRPTARSPSSSCASLG